jgi:hypothetical protein
VSERDRRERETEDKKGGNERDMKKIKFQYVSVLEMTRKCYIFLLRH